MGSPGDGRRHALRAGLAWALQPLLCSLVSSAAASRSFHCRLYGRSLSHLSDLGWASRVVPTVPLRWAPALHVVATAGSPLGRLLLVGTVAASRGWLPPSSLSEVRLRRVLADCG
eukprot:12739332-Alexandrium_andersonii.AAC.1